MLDLEALIADMPTLAEEVARSARSSLDRRALAREKLEQARGMEKLRAAVVDFAEDMALPIAGSDIGRTHSALPAEDYTVIATDGSQLAPDYHHIAPWYVINSGCAVFRYGAPLGRERCRLSSQPTLLPPHRAVRPDGHVIRRQSADDDDKAADALGATTALPIHIEVDRLEAELKLAIRLLDEEADPGRTVLLLDGPLVQWRMVTQIPSREERDRLLSVFRELLERARETETVVAGYISRSRAVEWTTLLRFSLCPEVAEAGRLCTECRKTLLGRYTEPPARAHHAPLAGVRDIELAGSLLAEPAAGPRSWSSARQPGRPLPEGAGRPVSSTCTPAPRLPGWSCRVGCGKRTR